MGGGAPQAVHWPRVRSLLLLLALMCPWRTALAEVGECDSCRYTFGYAYEFVAGRNFAIQRASDRTYFPANGLLRLLLMVLLLLEARATRR